MELIKRQLQAKEIPFELIYHDQPMLQSAEEGAAHFGIELRQTAPALILRIDQGYHALIVSGGRGRVDFKVIKKMIKAHDVRLAAKDELDKMGLIIGNIPLLGLELPYIIDRQLLQFESIYGGTGEPHWTLKVNPKALMELNHVVGILE